MKIPALILSTLLVSAAAIADRPQSESERNARSQQSFIATLTSTDRDNDGVVVATLTLTDVLVSSWTVGSSTHDAAPDEAVAFVFRKVCLAGSGSAQLCFDAATGTTT